MMILGIGWAIAAFWGRFAVAVWVLWHMGFKNAGGGSGCRYSASCCSSGMGV
jgi:hypothetical protein